MPKTWNGKSRKDDGITFNEWKEQVESECVAMCGMGTETFPDIDFWSNWDAGQSPIETAKDLLAENGF